MRPTPPRWPARTPARPPGRRSPASPRAGEAPPLGGTPGPGQARSPGASFARFAADVSHYLSLEPRQLPSRYLYDDLGSALFEAICRLPWYPLTRAEMRLLAAHAPEILDGRVTSIAELGAGSGLKLSELIRSSGSRPPRLDVQIVDVSAAALAEARQTLGEFPGLRLTTHETTYEAGLERLRGAPPARGRRLMLFLGSNIGNFDPKGRDLFLRAVRAALRPGDGLLIGVDLVKPAGALRLAYDDPLGVTAAFNLNLLARINRELWGDFVLDRFAHQVVWNRDESRIEMHLRSRRAQRVVIPAAGLDLTLREGETIWTESSYKYGIEGIVEMLRQAGFAIAAQWVDDPARFALTLAEAE
jgi:L-histidine N-alpha-methyltransferase